MCSTKICRVCNKEQTLSEFYKDKMNLDGLRNDCKTCNSAAKKAYSRTKEGLYTKLYSHQKYSSKKRGHEDPSYTKAELVDWLNKQVNFNTLYNTWVEQGYIKALTPSIDRLNDYTSYTLDNIQLMTWGENKAKGALDRKNGVNRKTSKGVLQFNLTGEFIAEYTSAMEAARQTKATQGAISNCCNKAAASAGGFVWEYI